jgi:transposase
MRGWGRGNQAIRYSRGGLITKIHALVDALGNPLAFLLTPGQAHDPAGADVLLPQNARRCAIADKAFDPTGASELLAAADKSAMIPPRPNRIIPSDFYPELFQGAPAHHYVFL